MMRTYIAFLASLTLVSVFIVNFLPFQEGESSVFHNSVIPYVPLLPTEVCAPGEAVAEPAPIFSQNVASMIEIPSEIYEPEPIAVAVDLAEQPVAQQFSPPAVVGAVDVPQTVSPTVPTLAPAESAPPPYVYFYTGVPVQPAPTAVFVYAGGAVHSVPMSMSPPAAPSPAPASGQARVVRTHIIPVFTPQVAPSRFGAPRLIYSNGVVIKPTVYFPNQPVRNTVRGFTP
ncbi:MAG: hypothetical protein FWG73_02680 [Planctomycetaceae bacterium]|nr:hypothetical protein [Planctomycetaceae bacterium]